MKFLPVSPESLKQGAEILKNGGLVAFPTETVYGLGADAFNAQALAKVFEVKGRPHFDPLIIHIAAIETLEKVACLSLLTMEKRKKLFLLAEALWPGPLSIIMPKNEKIPGIATSGLQTAAIRFPDHKAARDLISLSSGAVAAPSANLFGSLSPTSAQHVKDALGNKIDMILDGGSARIGVESTVLDITGENFKILRPGGTPKEVIEKLTGPVQGIDNEIKDETFCPKTSPGQLESHYAPRTSLSVLNTEEIIRLPCKDKKISYLFFNGSTRDAWFNFQLSNVQSNDFQYIDAQKLPADSIIRVLSETGQMQEAASRLFEILHELDKSNVSHIYAQLAPQEGLGEAINDRLKRGASK